MGRRRPALSPKWKKRFSDYKEDLLKAVLLTVPLALLAKLNEQVSARILSQPWQAIWFLVPIAIVAALLRQRAIRQHALHPDRRMLLFLGAYLLLFTVASQSGVLDVSRELSAFGAPASRRWLTPVSWGDWRYRLVPRKPERDQLIVVLLRSGADRSTIDGRKEIVDLIALASQQQARGVALDVYFNEPSAIDPLLCQVVTNAARTMPVFVGYGFEIQDGRVVELGVPPTLGPCLPPERLAHLAGFLDFDLVSRLTPLFFRGDTTRPALGLAVARALAATPSSLPLPPSGSSGPASIDLPDDGPGSLHRASRRWPADRAVRRAPEQDQGRESPAWPVRHGRPGGTGLVRDRLRASAGHRHPLLRRTLVDRVSLHPAAVVVAGLRDHPGVLLLADDRVCSMVPALAPSWGCVLAPPRWSWAFPSPASWPVLTGSTWSTRLLPSGCCCRCSPPPGGRSQCGSSVENRLMQIGQTPLIKLERMAPANGVEIWVKWEGANPTGSMKDRMALSMVLGAEQRGQLQPGGRVVDYTGGSTGSSLAMVCAARGYQAHFVSSDAFSEEKLQTMRAFGARLEVVPSANGKVTPDLIHTCLDRVRVLAAEPNTFWTDQFNNPDNRAGYYADGRRDVDRAGRTARRVRDDGRHRRLVLRERRGDRRRGCRAFAASRASRRRARSCLALRPPAATASKGRAQASCPAFTAPIWWTRSWRSPTKTPSPRRAVWRERKASSAASRRARTSGWRCSARHTSRRRTDCHHDLRFGVEVPQRRSVPQLRSAEALKRSGRGRHYKGVTFVSP